MSGWIQREDRLFDPVTGALAGYIDLNGREQLLNAPAIQGVVSGAGNGRGLRTVLLGDSLNAYNNYSVAISSITLSAGVITVVTSSAHQVRDGQLVNVSGTTNSTFHARLAPVTWISSTSFSYPAPAAAAGTATGGVVLCQNQLNACGDWVATNARLGGAMRFIANLGVPGQRADEILARIAEAWALSPDILWLNAGTNDVIQDRAYASTVADIETMVAAAAAKSVLVVLKTLPPFASGGAYYTAARNANLLAINRFIRNIATRYRGVYVLDVYAALIQPTDANGYGNSAYYQASDSVHYGPRGAARIGVKGAALLGSAIPMVDNHVTSIVDNYGANSANRDLCDNAPWTNSGGTVNAPAVSTPAWAATTAYAVNASVIASGRLYVATVAGTSSGVAPTHTSGTATDGSVTWLYVGGGAAAGAPAGWIIDAAGTWTVAPTIATVLRADGLGYDIVAIGQPGAAGCSATVRSSSTAQNARLPSFVGAKYRWVCEVNLTNAVASGVRSLNHFANAAVGSPSGVIASACSGLSQAGLLSFDSDAATTLMLATPDFVIPAGTVANCSMGVSVTMDAASASAVTLKIGSVRMQPMDDQ